MRIRSRPVALGIRPTTSTSWEQSRPSNSGSRVCGWGFSVDSSPFWDRSSTPEVGHVDVFASVSAVSLLDDVSNASTDSSVSVADLLRRVQIVAHRLGATAVVVWAR